MRPPRYFFLVCIVIFPFLFQSPHICVGEDQIPVGVLLPLTGKMASYGQMAQIGFELAAEEINAAGGINGDEIVLLVRDTESDSGAAEAAAKTLIQEDKVVVLTGGCSSSVTMAISYVAEEHEIPFLITSAAADRLTELGLEYVFRLNLPSSEYNKSLVEYLSRKRGLRKACIFREHSRYGWYKTKRFFRLCKRSRLMLSLVSEYDLGEYDFQSVISRIKEKEPDVMIIISKDLEEPVDFLGQIAESEWQPKIIIGEGPEFLSDSLYQLVGGIAEKIITNVLWARQLTYPGVKEFSEKCLKTYGLLPDYHAAQAYSGLYVIAEALKDSILITPSELRDSLNNINMMSVYGPVRFISYGKKDRQNRPSTYIMRWFGDHLAPAWPKPLPSIEPLNNDSDS